MVFCSTIGTKKREQQCRICYMMDLNGARWTQLIIIGVHWVSIIGQDKIVHYAALFVRLPMEPHMQV